MKKIYEFLLWNNCNNNCTFCHQRLHERKNTDKILTKEEQIKSLQLCKTFLQTTFEKGNHILLCGGEIFDVTDTWVKLHVNSLLSQVIDHMLADEIELLYLNTNLLYEDLELLEGFLENIKQNNLFERLRFTTSYDIEGRFNKNSELLFYKNLKYLMDTFADIRVVVNTILTKEACLRIREDRFGADYLLEYLEGQNKTKYTMKEWSDYFRVQINTIPYIQLKSDTAPTAPTKNEALATLLHLDTIMPGYLKWYAENIGLTQEKLLYEYNKANDEFVFCSSEMAECGHSVNFQLSFADSTDCFPCEVQKLLKYNK